MSSRERALRALQLEEPDRVPMFELEFQYPEKVIGKRYLVTGVNEDWEKVIFRGEDLSSGLLSTMSLFFPISRWRWMKFIGGEHFFVMHTDGYLWPILDGLVQTGIDALHSIDPSAGMRISDVKEKYGDRIALCGNVDAATVLAYGSPAKVAVEARHCIDGGAHGGGYFLTSSNCIYRGVPLANALALSDTGKRYGLYAQKMP